MRYYSADKAAIESMAQRIHDYLVQNDQAYAASVAAGQTVRWSPAVSDGAGGWYVPIDDRANAALTPQERTQLT